MTTFAKVGWRNWVIYRRYHDITQLQKLCIKNFPKNFIELNYQLISFLLESKIR